MEVAQAERVEEQAGSKGLAVETADARIVRRKEDFARERSTEFHNGEDEPADGQNLPVSGLDNDKCSIAGKSGSFSASWISTS